MMAIKVFTDWGSVCINWRKNIMPIFLPAALNQYYYMAGFASGQDEVNPVF